MQSTRTSVTVTIDAAPSSPTVIGTSICSGQTAMLTQVLHQVLRSIGTML
ncbi:MAG: hypothetical protein IPH74_11765 [Bacteroidetes bacterium]|nr:hypothetical protein [Bacteroidota bacterium]